MAETDASYAATTLPVPMDAGSDSRTLDAGVPSEQLAVVMKLLTVGEDVGTSQSGTEAAYTQEQQEPMCAPEEAACCGSAGSGSSDAPAALPPLPGNTATHASGSGPRGAMDVHAAKKAVHFALAGLDLTVAKQNLDASKAAVSAARANGEVPAQKHKVAGRSVSMRHLGTPRMGVIEEAGAAAGAPQPWRHGDAPGVGAASAHAAALMHPAAQAGLTSGAAAQRAGAAPGGVLRQRTPAGRCISLPHVLQGQAGMQARLTATMAQDSALSQQLLLLGGGGLAQGAGHMHQLQQLHGMAALQHAPARGGQQPAGVPFGRGTQVNCFAGSHGDNGAIAAPLTDPLMLMLQQQQQQQHHHHHHQHQHQHQQQLHAQWSGAGAFMAAAQQQQHAAQQQQHAVQQQQQQQQHAAQQQQQQHAAAAAAAMCGRLAAIGEHEWAAAAATANGLGAPHHLAGVGGPLQGGQAASGRVSPGPQAFGAPSILPPQQVQQAQAVSAEQQQLLDSFNELACRALSLAQAGGPRLHEQLHEEGVLLLALLRLYLALVAGGAAAAADALGEVGVLAAASRRHVATFSGLSDGFSLALQSLAYVTYAVARQPSGHSPLDVAEAAFRILDTFGLSSRDVMVAVAQQRAHVAAAPLLPASEGGLGAGAGAAHQWLSALCRSAAEYMQLLEAICASGQTPQVGAPGGQAAQPAGVGLGAAHVYQQQQQQQAHGLAALGTLSSNPNQAAVGDLAPLPGFFNHLGAPLQQSTLQGGAALLPTPIGGGALHALTQPPCITSAASGSATSLSGTLSPMSGHAADAAAALAPSVEARLASFAFGSGAARFGAVGGGRSSSFTAGMGRPSQGNDHHAQLLHI